MNKTLGKKISELRKQRKMTQDELAEKMGVSAQAVSKWENDLSIPDLPILMELSDFFGVTLDDLVKDKKETVKIVPEENRKPLEQMFLKVNVKSVAGDKVKVNLPLAFVKMALDMGMEINAFGNGEYLKGIDFAMIFAMIENGAIGKLVEVESAAGDIVEITVE